MSEEKFPLMVGVHLILSDPFVAYTTDNHVMIVQQETLYNQDGMVLYYEERVVNAHPTKEEIFKVNLKNPQENKQVAWGFNKDSVTGDTVSSGQRRLKDS